MDLNYLFLLFLFLIENGLHEIRGFCFCNFVFWELQGNLADRLYLIMFFQWRPNEMREGEGEGAEVDGGHRPINTLSCFFFFFFFPPILGFTVLRNCGGSANKSCTIMTILPLQVSWYK